MELVLLSVCVVLGLALLAPLCLHCHRRPPRSISETRTSEDIYNPSSHFRIHRPMQVSTDQNYVHPPSNHLSPHVSMDRPKRPSFTATETESNNSYENAESMYSNSEMDILDPGYVEVIPDAAPEDNGTRPSSPSDSEHNYVNLAETETVTITERSDETSANHSSSDDYLNVRMEPDSSSDSDSDSDDEGNYVNQPLRVE